MLSIYFGNKKLMTLKYIWNISAMFGEQFSVSVIHSASHQPDSDLAVCSRLRIDAQPASLGVSEELRSVCSRNDITFCEN